MDSIEEAGKEVPLKSTRKGVVVTIQGLSVIAVLEGAFAFLRAKFGLEVSAGTVHLIVAMLTPIFTGFLHGAIKRACFKLGIDLRFTALPKSFLLLFIVLLPLVGLGGCALVRQVNVDETSKYSATGLALGKGNITDLQTSMSQKVFGDGSETIIGQQTSEIETDATDLLGQALSALSAALQLYEKSLTVGNEPAASGGNSNVKNTTGGGLPPIKFSGE